MQLTLILLLDDLGVHAFDRNRWNRIFCRIWDRRFCLETPSVAPLPLRFPKNHLQTYKG